MTDLRQAHGSPLAGSKIRSVVVDPLAPNFLIFLADDQGYGEVSAMRQGFTNLNRNITTPNIDKLMATGMRFTNFYANSECSVSRGSLLTGKHSGHATIRGNKGGYLKANDPTFLQTLQQYGYKTACQGKWHVNGVVRFRDNPASMPWNKGCNTFYGGEDSGWRYPTDRVWRYTADKGLVNNAFPANANATRARCMATGNKCVWLSDLLLADALSELQYHADRQAAEKKAGLTPAPFLIYLAWSDPHSGFWNQADVDLKGNPVPSNGKFGLEKTWPTIEQDHAASIVMYLDVYIGKVMDKLTMLGLLDKTVVIYASDNGPADSKGLDVTFFQSAGKLQGSKLSLQEGGIRVPFSVSYSGNVAAGAVTDAPVAIWDLGATILDMARVPKNAWTPGMDGVSFYAGILQQPAVNGKVTPAGSFDHPPLYWERCIESRNGRPDVYSKRGGSSFSRAVRDGPWKGVQQFFSGTFSEFRLYNLATDIGESNDVAAANPTVVAKLKGYLTSLRTSAANGFNYPATDDCAITYGAPV